MLNRPGILLATTYTAFASIPMKRMTTNLSETRMTQEDMQLGTMGQEYLSISRSLFLLKQRRSIYLYILALKTRKTRANTTDIRRAMTVPLSPALSQ